jgi:glycosyltransferase involved in cell wall biosynthesis|tara:strand:+ start:1033 stop:1995 length:963 start_codon:yes stop_codon:yes gene_type:complete
MLVYAPLEHLDQRYTTHLDRDIREYLDRNNINYIYLEPKTINNDHKISKGSFLDSDNTIYRQFYQFNTFIKGLLSGEIAKNSTYFTTDIWNISVLAIPYLNFFSDYNIKLKGVLHAGSFTDTDFVRQMERYYKGFEDIVFDIASEIYVASNFIKDDLLKKRVVDPNKIKVTGLPMDEINLAQYDNKKKKNIIVFNGRNVDEKQPHLFDALQKALPEYEFVNTQKLNMSKGDYYGLLNMSKVVVSFALQENFGYGIQEAVRLGCVPILPNRLVYPEQFDQRYLYNNFNECIEKVKLAMLHDWEVPKVNLNSNEEIFKKWFQ